MRESGTTIDAMTIDGAGKVGIGTTNPQDLLSFDIPSGTTKGIFFQDNASHNYGTKLKYGETENKFYIEQIENDVQTGIFTIQRVDGNVGIGTNYPSCTFDVEGGR